MSRREKENSMRNAIAGTILAAGLGVAGMMGAGNAAALGLSVDLNGDGESADFGSGATTTQSGNASNNPALAVSILGPAATSASGNANGNTLVAIDGLAAASGNANGNTVVGVLGASSASGNAHNNTLVNVGGNVQASGNASGATSLSVCGTSFTGQADHVTVSHGVC